MVTSTRSKGAGKRRETPAKSGSSKKAKKSVAAAKLCTNDVDPDEASETTETKSVSEDSEGNPGENATPRKAYDGKPTILEYLQNKPTEVRNAAMHELVAEGYAGDKNASEEILGFMMSTTLTPVLVMMPGSSFPQIGHSLFQYNSSARKADENHRDFILFVGDRTIRGDPTGFVVDVDGGNMPGTLKEYDAHEDGVEIETFLQDPANDGLLFAQSTLTTTKRNALQVLPINDDVAEFVAANNPSMHDLDAWVNHVDNNKVEDEEAANIIDWMHMAILSNDDEKKKKKSSILALDCQAVTSPSDELAQCMEERLDATIGRAQDTTPQARGPSAGEARLQRQINSQDTQIRELTAAKKLAAGKDKWSDGTWARLCGYSGVNGKALCSPTLHELEECSNVDDALSILSEAFRKAADKHGLRVTSDMVTEDFAKMLMKGQMIPAGVHVPLETNIPKTFSHMLCVPWTSEQLDEYAQQRRATAVSTNTRTYAEAVKLEEKEITGKLSRPPPTTFHAIQHVTEDHLIRSIALLTEDSPMTIQLFQVHDFLKSFVTEGNKVPADAWRAFSYRLFVDETQFFATKASEANLIDNENLPVCTFIESGTLWALRYNKTIPQALDALPTWKAKSTGGPDRQAGGREPERNQGGGEGLHVDVRQRCPRRGQNTHVGVL